ncbi:uncharacterized protein (TIGR02246 family) [Paraburkholderia sp. HC6.4b]|uniref:YybH family protein n=1 Tax=unclassified Paraburkholderia TaxID=2615204 RepID=UPI00160A72FD|nr:MULTISPECIES: SgcJ/EcaC family oxidoreductase [unclassified Paraburkholderia]MBB5406303.1 uncharacterized protein (TIGR02246 family) [Paraburkholderia sp. HC6.4b]MBB5448700.1 uncharacterized protein (TIGR02246 family) [Paraburkholderia sp. Kb1A]
MNRLIAAGNVALASVQAAWNVGAQNWDSDALTRVYTKDALFFGGRPGHSVGTDAIRDYFASYQGVIESAALELVEQHLIELGAGCFLAQGYGNFSFTLSGNRMTRSHLRTTLVIVLQDGEWRILQHHFSAKPESPPIGA